MKHPDKWRDTVDIFALPFQKIRILEVLGYPHAGNDVFHVRASYGQRETTAFVKVERQLGADISNEVNILSALPFTFVPEILEYSLDAPRFIVTRECFGDRLSVIAKNDGDADIHAYLSKQAYALCSFHRLQIDCEQVKDRRFFHIPPEDFCEKHSLESVRSFLMESAPHGASSGFVHGDFHYANMLWMNESLSCVLDWELSGFGVREFDMAWAIFLRPGQAFASDWHDVCAFLRGYEAEYSLPAFCYYYIQIAAYFYAFGDQAYKEKVLQLIACATDAYHGA